MLFIRFSSTSGGFFSGWAGLELVLSGGNAAVGSLNVGRDEVRTIFGYRNMVSNTGNNIPTTELFLEVVITFEMVD